MGVINRFHLAAMCQRYGFTSFVETGTGSGDSLAFALQAPFARLISIECVGELAEAARARFRKHDRVTIVEGTTDEWLPKVIETLPDEPTLFWLDAHFAGADYGLAKYDAEPDIRRRLPASVECEIIRTGRKRPERDFILIDDARIWVRGDFGAGDLPDDFPGIVGVERNLDWLYAGLGKTHGIVVDYADQGYVMCAPRLTYSTVNGLA